MIARSVRVTGRIQGVFFRSWTAEQARALGVAGGVRNTPGGSVEGHLEGEEASVQELIELLHQGPPAARVEHVDVDDSQPEGAANFEVRH